MKSKKQSTKRLLDNRYRVTRENGRNEMVGEHFGMDTCRKNKGKERRENTVEVLERTNLKEISTVTYPG